MAVKRSVIEIDVDDARFNRFVKAYEKYDAMLQDAPGVWKGVNKETASQANIARIIGAAMLAQSEAGKRIENTQSRMASNARRMSDYWKDAAKSIRDVEVRLFRTVQSAARWTGITGAIAGLAAGGGVWGLERLATAANVGRRSATGLGLSYGQQTAFGLAYQRLINSQSFVGGISTARGDITSGAAGALWTLGMNPMMAGSTGDVANEALKRIRGLAQQTPEEQLGVLQQSRMLGELGLSVEDLRRLKTMSNAEFGEYQAVYTKRATQLDIADRTLRLWQDLDVQLETSAQKLKTGLIEGLVKLAKPLGDVSDALSDFVRSLLGSDGFKHVIETIAKGLRTFADYVKRDEFKTDVQTFIDAISKIARKMVDVLQWLGLIPDSGKPGAGPPPLLRDTPGHWMYKPRPGASMEPSVWDVPKGAPTMGWQGIKDWFSNLPWLPSKSRFPYDMRPVDAGAMEKYRRAISGIESGSPSGNYGALGPVTSRGDRAYGRYQVMGANIPSWTERALGRSLSIAEFLANPQIQDKVFDHIFGQYVKKYGEEGAARAWFAGEAGMKNINASDAIPGVHRGLTVGQYGQRFVAGLGGQPTVKVDINNNTGGNSTVVVSSMGIVAQ